MYPATKQLIDEHKAVKLMLSVLTSICDRIGKGEKINYTHLDRIVELVPVSMKNSMSFYMN